MLVQCVGLSKSITAGHPTVLTYDEEKEIVATCQAMQDLGFWLDTGDGGSGSLRLLTINRKA